MLWCDLQQILVAYLKGVTPSSQILHASPHIEALTRLAWTVAFEMQLCKKLQTSLTLFSLVDKTVVYKGKNQCASLPKWWRLQFFSLNAPDIIAIGYVLTALFVEIFFSLIEILWFTVLLIIVCQAHNSNTDYMIFRAWKVKDIWYIWRNSRSQKFAIE